MKRSWWKPIFLLFIICTLFKCIEPFSPNIEKFESLLVVDALITDENSPNYVKISRTEQKANQAAVKVTGAQVTITDDLGTSTNLTEKADGLYKTDSLTFRGEAGRTYTLHINTSDGTEYRSDACLMYPVQDIDSIYYKFDQQIVDNEEMKGINIYLKSKATDLCGYNRWAFCEYWKIKVPLFSQFEYINEDTFDLLTTYKRICYASEKSGEILIRSSEEDIDFPVLFIPGEKTPRLNVQYCIEIKQLSLSKDEYEFWNCMKQIGESGSNIFDKQPFQVSGNIYNISNPNQRVLGYFQVSAAKMRRKYITCGQVSALGVPLYSYPCTTITAVPNQTLHTWDDVYSYYIASGYIFIQPIFSAFGLSGLIFANPLCADCTVSGVLTKPDFWVDL
jgi:hypothetical protein